MRMLRKLYVQARLDIDDDMMDAMITNEHIPTDHDDNGILRVDMDSCEQYIDKYANESTGFTYPTGNHIVQSYPTKYGFGHNHQWKTNHNNTFSQTSLDGAIKTLPDDAKNVINDYMDSFKLAHDKECKELRKQGLIRAKTGIISSMLHVKNLTSKEIIENVPRRRVRMASTGKNEWFYDLETIIKRLNDGTVPIERITFTDKGKAFLKHGGDESIVNIVNARNNKAC